MGYDNPAFKIHIISPNDSLQPPRGTKRHMNIAIGDSVSFRHGDIEVYGKISGWKLTRNGESILFVYIVTEKGKKYRVSMTDLVSKNSNLDTDNTSSPGIFAESILLDFKQFQNSL